MSDGATSLFIASKKGHTDIVKVLLAQNANIDAHMTNSKRETSLFIASKNGHSEIIKILSDKKAETKRGATRQILNTLKFKR
ncbi:hypothetical protein B0H16DRAFT_1520241 [Mycena metata]|uniref:Ankyrin repeat protein n=1 Tax=Mycena metata TaxID=1033252 RepID=A0AAD7NMS8_9AGAR|nr:hypothetical protein B0H16DRAFT_1520241 [Mycena metata]